MLSSSLRLVSATGTGDCRRRREPWSGAPGFFFGPGRNRAGQSNRDAGAEANLLRLSPSPLLAVPLDPDKNGCASRTLIRHQQHADLVPLPVPADVVHLERRGVLVVGVLVGLL